MTDRRAGRPMLPYGRADRLPGQPPPVWRGLREDELFAGRDDELEEIWNRLVQHGRVALVPVGGRSGVGETELASAYQHRYRLRYDVAWWVACDAASNIPAQLAELGERTALALGQGDCGAWPKPGRGWLMIFAGAVSLAQIKPYLPTHGAHIIVVAQHPEKTWQDRTMTIGPLTSRESVMLLTTAAPMVDPDTAARIGELVGYRPASLREVAGHLIRERTLTPELCQRLLELVIPAPPDIQPTVPTTPVSSAGPAADEAPAAARPPAGRRGQDNGSWTPSAGATPSGPPAAGPPAAGSAGSPGASAVVPPDARGGAGGETEPMSPGWRWGADTTVPVLGEDMPAGRPADMPRRRPRPADQLSEVDGLVAALERVEYIADVDGFDHWVAEVRRLSGHAVVLASPFRATRLTTLVSDAVRRPRSGLLEALVRGLELVCPRGDREVAAFRELVVEVGREGGGGTRAGSRSDQRDPEPASSFATWDLTGAREAPPPVRGPGGAANYYFFTSHAHRADRDRVVAFHRALELELGRKVRRRIQPAGFLDAERMGGGDHWPTALRDSVRTAPVLVALWTDDYFESEWCGREFGIFQERIRRATSPGGNPPAGIIPVPWLGLEEDVPAAATELHLARIDLGRKYDNMPVLDLMRHPAAFEEYVSLLAYRVMDVARDALPALDAEAADRVASPFHGNGS